MRAQLRVGVVALALALLLLFVLLLATASRDRDLFDARLTPRWVPGGFPRPPPAVDAAAAHLFDADAIPPGGRHVVVFGDSWVSAAPDAWPQQTWPERLCEEMHCTSFLNFAPPATDDALEGWTGAVLSNALAADVANATGRLPDLRAQMAAYAHLAPSTQPTEILFIVAFGLWDVQTYAVLARREAKAKVESSIKALLELLDALQSHVSGPGATSASPTPTTTFRVIIPRVFDQTFLPGWAERAAGKTAVQYLRDTLYLVTRWNQYLEARLMDWNQKVLSAPVETPFSVDGGPRESHTPWKPWTKATAILDVQEVVMRSILERQLQDGQIEDSSGFGSLTSPYMTVRDPCVVPATQEQELVTAGAVGSGVDPEALRAGSIQTCADPAQHLFWDAWHIGPQAHHQIAAEAIEMLRSGQTLPT